MPRVRSFNPQLNDYQNALLDTISGTESPSYNTLYGGGTFPSYADHPRIGVTITSGPHKGEKSTAAGAYQILGSTWDGEQRKLGLPNFQPPNQQLAAYDLAKTAYGPNLDTDLQDPSKIPGIGSALSGTWTSLPGGIEAQTNSTRFARQFANNLADQQNASYVANAPPNQLAANSLAADSGARFNDRQATISAEHPSLLSSLTSPFTSAINGIGNLFSSQQAPQVPTAPTLPRTASYAPFGTGPAGPLNTIPKSGPVTASALPALQMPARPVSQTPLIVGTQVADTPPTTAPSYAEGTLGHLLSRPQSPVMASMAPSMPMTRVTAMPPSTPAFAPTPQQQPSLPATAFAPTAPQTVPQAPQQQGGQWVSDLKAMDAAEGARRTAALTSPLVAPQVTPQSPFASQAAFNVLTRPASLPTANFSSITPNNPPASIPGMNTPPDNIPTLRTNTTGVSEANRILGNQLTPSQFRQSLGLSAVPGVPDAPPSLPATAQSPITAPTAQQAVDLSNRMKAMDAADLASRTAALKTALQTTPSSITAPAAFSMPSRPISPTPTAPMPSLQAPSMSPSAAPSIPQGVNAIQSFASGMPSLSTMGQYAGLALGSPLAGAMPAVSTLGALAAPVAGALAAPQGPVNSSVISAPTVPGTNLPAGDPASPVNGAPVAPPSTLNKVTPTLGDIKTGLVGAKIGMGAGPIGAAAGFAIPVLGGIANRLGYGLNSPFFGGPTPNPGASPATQADVVAHAAPSVLAQVNRMGYGALPAGSDYHYGYSPFGSGISLVNNNDTEAHQIAATGPGLLGALGFGGPSSAPSLAAQAAAARTAAANDAANTAAAANASQGNGNGNSNGNNPSGMNKGFGSSTNSNGRNGRNKNDNSNN